MAQTAGWKIFEMSLNGDQGALPSGQVRLELSNLDNEGNFARTVQAVLDATSGTLVSHDDSMEFMPMITGWLSNTAEYPPAGDGTYIYWLTDGQANISWAGPDEYISGSGSGTEGSGTFTIPGATHAVWWYSHHFDRLFAVFKNASEALGLAACVNATGECETSAAPEINWRLEFNPDMGSTRIMDNEKLVSLPLECCVCKSFETFTYTLDANGRLQLSPVVPVNEALSNNGVTLYDTEANEVWVGWGDTGAECDGEITVTRYDYASGQTSASIAIGASTIASAVGGSSTCGGGGGLPGWASAVIGVGAAAVVGISVAVGLQCHRAKKPDSKALQVNKA
jgi:hypothetical protein